MRLTLLALLLLAFPANAGEPSVAQELYLEELRFTIEDVLVKQSHNQATDYDNFSLVKATERLNQYTHDAIPIAVFAANVVNRQPVQIVTVAPKNSQVFFYTILINLNGRTVEHVFLIDGIVVHRQPFQVGGDRWRVWSSINTRNATHFQVLVYADNYLIASKRLSVQ